MRLLAFWEKIQKICRYYSKNTKWQCYFKKRVFCHWKWVYIQIHCLVLYLYLNTEWFGLHLFSASVILHVGNVYCIVGSFIVWFACSFRFCTLCHTACVEEWHINDKNYFYPPMLYNMRWLRCHNFMDMSLFQIWKADNQKSRPLCHFVPALEKDGGR